VDGGAQFWDVSSGARRGQTLWHHGRIKSVAFSPDGALAATGGLVEDPDPETRDRAAGEAQLWKVATARPLGSALFHPAPVWSVAFGPGGSTLLTGCEDGGARLFLTATGAPVGSPLKHEGTVRAVTFSPDGKCALTASAGGYGYAAARLWDLPPESAFAKSIVHKGEILALSLSPDGQALLAGSRDRTGRLWDLTTGTLIDPPLAHEGAVVATAFSPDGRTLLTGSEDGVARLWDRATLRPQGPVMRTDWVCSAAISPDGRSVVLGGHNGSASMWEAATGKALGDLKPNLGPVWCVAFSPDGQKIISASAGGIVLWDWRTRLVLHEWRTPLDSTTAVFYPDGKKVLLVTGGFAQVWDLDKEQFNEPPPFHPEGGMVFGTFSPDGRSILIAGANQVPRLWDVATGRTLGPALGRDRTYSIAFCPNGRKLATGSLDGVISIWDLPQPLEDSVEQVRLRIELLLGMELDSKQLIHELSPDALQERRQHLEELGAGAGRR